MKGLFITTSGFTAGAREEVLHTQKIVLVDGKKLAETVAKEIGSTSLGSVQSKMYTGLNYADSIKSYQLVIGYLSNSNDDALLTNEETPYKVAIAIAEFLRK